MKVFLIQLILIIGILILSLSNLIAQNILVKKDSAVLSFQEYLYDFGKIYQDEKVTHEFRFINTGNKPLVISNVERECGCTSYRWTPEPIMPGGEGEVWATIIFETGYGNIMKPLHIFSNATIPQMDIYIKCELLSEKLNSKIADSLKNTLNLH